MKPSGITITFKGENSRNRILKIATDVTAAVIVTVAFWLIVFRSLDISVSSGLWLKEGLPLFINSAAERITELTYRLHINYENSGGIINYLFAPVAIAVTGVLSYLWVKSSFRGITALFLAAVLAGNIFAVIPDDGFIRAAVIAFCIVSVYRFAKAGKCEKRDYNALILTAGFLVVFLIFICVTAIAGPDNKAAAENISDGICRTIHESRYEENENPMPEGRVSEAGSFKPEDIAALRVSESHWETTYLRGFTGETYKDGRWDRIDGKKAARLGSLFYWLHDEGFYGQSQLATAYENINSKAEDFVSVVNSGACSRYCYMPYGFSQNEKSITDPMAIGDLNITVDSKEDSSDYMWSIVGGAVKNSSSLQKKIRKLNTSKAPELDSYLDAEEAYRKACEKMYLDIPADTEKVLKRQLGKKEELTPSDAMKKVTEYLEENISYSEKTSVTPENEDFIKYFLIKSGKGYSIHYASAAVMMLRYYGVPARYVEGFIIPARVYKQTQDGEMISLNMKYSHAWAEYYLDGVGWLPFETVPKYMGSGTNKSDGGNGGIKKENKQQNENSNTDNPMNRIGRVFVMNIPLIIAGFLLLIVVLAILTLIRRKRLKAFIGTFDDDDRNKAVRNAFAYSVALMSLTGMEVNRTCLRETEFAADEAELREEFISCISINEKARYSPGKIEENEHETVIRFTRKMMEKAKTERKLINRIGDRVIKVII